MSNISFNKNILYSNEKLQFDYDIAKIVEIDGINIVLLDISPQDNMLNNLYGVVGGDIVWRVQDYLEIDPDFSPTFYVLIKKTEQNEIVTTDFNGCRFIINPLNGKIIGRKSSIK